MISFDGEHANPCTGVRYQYAGTAVEVPDGQRIDCVASFFEGDELRHMVDAVVDRHPGETSLAAAHRWAAAFVESIALKVLLLLDMSMRWMGETEAALRIAAV